jgi:hypothetical protein
MISRALIRIKKAKASEHFEKFLEFQKDSDLGIAELRRRGTIHKLLKIKEWAIQDSNLRLLLCDLFRA